MNMTHLMDLASDGSDSSSGKAVETTDSSLMIGLVVFIAALLTVGLVAAICACKQKCKDKKEQGPRPRAS